MGANHFSPNDQRRLLERGAIKLSPDGYDSSHSERVFPVQGTAKATTGLGVLLLLINMNSG